MFHHNNIWELNLSLPISGWFTLSLPILLEIDHGVGAAADHHGDVPVEPPQRLRERGLLDALVRALLRLHHRVLPGHPADRLRAVRHPVVREDHDVHLESGKRYP